MTPIETPILILILWAIVGYTMGSVPFGIVLSRLMGLGDLRKLGSGNIGATNVLRTGRKGLAAATLLLDALKGVAAVLVADQVGQLAAVGAALSIGLGLVLARLVRPRAAPKAPPPPQRALVPTARLQARVRVQPVRG